MLLFKTDTGLIQTEAPEDTLRSIWKTYHQMRYDFVFPSFTKFLQENGFPAQNVRVPAFTYESTGYDLSMN